MKRKRIVVLVIALVVLCVLIGLGIALWYLFGGNPNDGGGNGDDTTIVTPGDPDDEPGTPENPDDEPDTPGDPDDEPGTGENPGDEPGTPENPDDEPDTPGDPDDEPETPHEHTYTSAVTKEPTCTQEGEMTYTCTCGDSYTEPIAMIPHNYVDGVCTMCGTPEPQPTEGLVFTLSDDGTQYSVTVYKGAETEVTITATYKGLPVTGIGGNAFFNCSSLTSIEIPDSVTSIGDYAFQSCSSLTSIEMPDSITSIGSGAFRGTAYYDDESNWEHDVLYIGNHLIKARSTLSGTYSIRNGTKTIAGSAFYNCDSLTKIEIPDSVISIGGNAFFNCSSLTSIEIPDSVTSIGDGALFNCRSLAGITVARGNPVYHSTGNSLIETDSKTLIKGCNSSVIPTDGSVTSIGHFAFWGCDGLTSITIPSGVTSIGQGAFYDCSSLTSVVIPDGVTSIGNGAFGSCSCLTSITLPDSITCIVTDAFYNTAYYNDESNWENDVLYIGNHLIKARDNLSGDYIIRQGTKTIADCAFWYCRSLTSIVIPDSVTSIGDYAFYDCISLTSIEIPDSVTSIGYSAFQYCNSLTSVMFEYSWGWYVTRTPGGTSGMDLASSELSDPATAAKYLRSTYWSYNWYKR